MQQLLDPVDNTVLGWYSIQKSKTPIQTHKMSSICATYAVHLILESHTYCTVRKYVKSGLMNWAISDILPLYSHTYTGGWGSHGSSAKPEPLTIHTHLDADWRSVSCPRILQYIFCMEVKLVRVIILSLALLRDWRTKHMQVIFFIISIPRLPQIFWCHLSF